MSQGRSLHQAKHCTIKKEHAWRLIRYIRVYLRNIGVKMPIIVPAAARTMSLLELFAREKRELSNADLARLLDLPESSCSDLLHTLHELGYLLRTPRSRRFYPTARLLSVARQTSATHPPYPIPSYTPQPSALRGGLGSGRTAARQDRRDGAVRPHRSRRGQGAGVHRRAASAALH